MKFYQGFSIAEASKNTCRGSQHMPWKCNYRMVSETRKTKLWIANGRLQSLGKRIKEPIYNIDELYHTHSEHKGHNRSYKTVTTPTRTRRKQALKNCFIIVSPIKDAMPDQPCNFNDSKVYSFSPPLMEKDNCFSFAHHETLLLWTQ